MAQLNPSLAPTMHRINLGDDPNAISIADELHHSIILESHSAITAHDLLANLRFIHRDLQLCKVRRITDQRYLLLCPDSWRSDAIAKGRVTIGPHCFTVSTDFSCLFSSTSPVRVWIRVFNLDYDMRGLDSLALVIQPFGTVLDHDYSTKTRSDLSSVRVWVEVAHTEVIPSFLWFEVTRANGWKSFVRVSYEIDEAPAPQTRPTPTPIDPVQTSGTGKATEKGQDEAGSSSHSQPTPYVVPPTQDTGTTPLPPATTTSPPSATATIRPVTSPVQPLSDLLPRSSPQVSTPPSHISMPHTYPPQEYFSSVHHLRPSYQAAPCYQQPSGPIIAVKRAPEQSQPKSTDSGTTPINSSSTNSLHQYPKTAPGPTTVPGNLKPQGQPFKKKNKILLKNRPSKGKGKYKVVQAENKALKTQIPTEKEKEPDPSSKPKVYTYHEPEFFQFDTLRDRTKFAVDQVWAVYDDCDGMSRFYALIKSLHTTPKFCISFVWLEVDPDKSTWAWHRAGLPIATGTFKLGGEQTDDEILMFSHVVSCGKGSKKNTFSVYPRKGEVWAMFKDWDSSWSSKSGKNRKFEYEMVEVVSDVTDSTGFVVMPLVKINGFVSIFMHSREAAPVVIPSSEVLRFSHSVPLYRITGNERNGVLEGAFELDPASLPPDLDGVFSSNNLDPKAMQKPSTNPSSEHKEEKKEERKNHGGGKEGDVEEISSPEPHDHGFYSFSDARSIEKFEPGQIWALYSEIDTLPKYYAMVKRIDMENESVFIKWLEQHGESVFGVDKSQFNPVNPFGCGIFRIAVEAGEWYEIDAFSHQMIAKPGSGKNVYEIKPAKTETWAVYRNWSVGWSLDDIKNCQYDVVRISEVNQAGITVLFLDKVVGYKSVFRLDSKRNPMMIPNGQLMKFSHRIPVYRLTHQVDGRLSGCWELDPAALPESLLC